jgi:hypothetical protein
MPQFIKEEAREEDFRPEWARVREAAERIGIKESRFYELLNEAKGAIRTCVLKTPGAERGARLIYLPSLFIYLENLAIEQQDKNASGE